MKTLLVALAVAGVLGGCSFTEAAPPSSRVTEVRTNNTEKTVQVPQPQPQPVEVTRPVNVRVTAPVVVPAVVTVTATPAADKE